MSKIHSSVFHPLAATRTDQGDPVASTPADVLRVPEYSRLDIERLIWPQIGRQARSDVLDNGGDAETEEERRQRLAQREYGMKAIFAISMTNHAGDLWQQLAGVFQPIQLPDPIVYRREITPLLEKGAQEKIALTLNIPQRC